MRDNIAQRQPDDRYPNLFAKKTPKTRTVSWETYANLLDAYTQLLKAYSDLLAPNAGRDRCHEQ